MKSKAEKNRSSNLTNELIKISRSFQRIPRYTAQIVFILQIVCYFRKFKNYVPKVGKQLFSQTRQTGDNIIYGYLSSWNRSHNKLRLFPGKSDSANFYIIKTRDL